MEKTLYVITLLMLLCFVNLTIHAQQRTDSSLVLGADISFWSQLEDSGAQFKVESSPKGLLRILQDHGINTIRLRLWHSPDEPWNGLEETLRTAKTIKDAGFELLLDFHYSDSWADPGKQSKPAVWEGLAYNVLVDSIYAYTQTVLSRLKDQGTSPAYVQIGNEISTGMLWDDGRVGGVFDTPVQWGNLAGLLKSAINAVEDVYAEEEAPAIILHTDHGGNLAASSWFFGNIENEEVPYDIVGLSYYPFWHGNLDDLRSTLEGITSEMAKPVMILETAYPWTLQWFDNVNNIIGLPEHVLPGFQATPEGQYNFLKSILEIVNTLPSSQGLGIVYWAPEYIAVPGVGSPWENLALFDEEGNALQGLKAFQEEVQSVHVEPEKAIRLPVNRITFFPAPFIDELNISIEVDVPTAVQLTFYTLHGREVYQYEDFAVFGKHVNQLDLRTMPAGVYLYKGFLGDQSVSGTLVKSR